MDGIIDAGGGLRGIYGAGVFDYCLDRGIRFGYCIGISAGSANIASYLAKQRGRNYRFYMEYAFRKQYMSLGNLVRTGSYLDLDYVYGGLSNQDGENPLDYEALEKSESIMKVVALNAQTGETVYFDKRDMAQDDYHILKASSNLPVVNRPYWANGIPCYDGGMADPIPLKKAFEDGCGKVAVILTKPRDLLREQKKDVPPARLLRRRYPAAADQLLLRYKKYNDGVALAKKLEQQGKALIIAPDDCCGMNTLTKSRKSMEQMYQKGYSDAAALPEFLSSGENTIPA